MWEGSQEDNRGLLPLVSAGRRLRGGFKSPGNRFKLGTIKEPKAVSCLNSVCTEGLGARGDEEGAAGSALFLGKGLWDFALRHSTKTQLVEHANARSVSASTCWIRGGRWAVSGAGGEGMARPGGDCGVPEVPRLPRTPG